jgi:hypothetical protein
MAECDDQGLESKYDPDTEVLTVIVDRRMIENERSMTKLTEMLRVRLKDPEVRTVAIFPRKGS